MKYIDAELLWKEIEKNKNTIDGMFTEGDDSVYDGENDAYNRVLRIINSLQQEQPVTTNTLTWKDIIDIEQILNQVRYEYNCGIGEEFFGKEVLERFLEQRDELLEQPEDDVRNEDAQDKVEEKPRYCAPRYWDGQYDQSGLFKEQPVMKKSNALFDECVKNCDPAVMKEVSDNIDQILGRPSAEGLEEEIKKWIDGGDITDTRYDDYDDGDIERTARHFAEWGAENLKK